MLFEDLNTISEMWFLDNYKNIPLHISTNLNSKFEIRNYQKEAFARFSYYFSDYKNKILPIHLLFNMATWSGKTFVMASLILELYEKWYRNFLFFVNSTNIIEKTKENFINTNSSKYLFNDKLVFNWKQIKIKEVTNFSTSLSDDINIKFITIHWLHTDLNSIKENGLSYEDFEENKIVILSDEAHHINSTSALFNALESEIKQKEILYRWTTEFIAKSIKNTFTQRDWNDLWEAWFKKEKFLIISYYYFNIIYKLTYYFNKTLGWKENLYYF